MKFRLLIEGFEPKMAKDVLAALSKEIATWEENGEYGVYDTGGILVGKVCIRERAPALN